MRVVSSLGGEVGGWVEPGCWLGVEVHLEVVVEKTAVGVVGYSLLANLFLDYGDRGFDGEIFTI